jgi:hypothetical protein
MNNTENIRNSISLVALAEEAGAEFSDAHHLRSRCPLPRHAGDRSSLAFSIYDNGRKWKCHSACPEDASGGDVVSFYMAWKQVDFKTAVQELSERVGVSFVPQRIASLPEPPRPPQSALWMERALEFVSFAEQNLTPEVREYLEKERGLFSETVKAFRLGYNPTNLYEDPQRWGLEGRKIWLPRGIVIPGFNNEKVSYVKIRRSMQNDALGEYIGAWTERDGAEGVKFGGPRGGSSVLFRLEFNDHFPVLLLTEGEWDTMLVWEHAADLCDVGTIGGAQSKFDSLDLALLTRYLAILVVHDNDSAGDKGRGYISKLHAVSERIVPIEPPAHDLTDFWKSGGDLRSWIAKQVQPALASALHTVKGVVPVRWQKILAHLNAEVAQMDGFNPILGKQSSLNSTQRTGIPSEKDLQNVVERLGQAG